MTGHRTFRRIAVEALTGSALALVAACALLGGDGIFPQALTTSGTGPFREVTANETGITLGPVGRIMDAPDTGIERAMIAANRLYAAIARPIEPAPARDPALPPYAFDPGQFEDRGIYVFCPLDVPPLQAGCLNEFERMAFGFNVNRVIEPLEPWEGAELYDPWAIELENGRVRLYYAAAGGIGVAEASGPGGPFTRLRSTPVMIPSGTMTVARSPSVIFDAAFGWFLYFDGGDGIYVATSSDGLTFTLANGGTALPLLLPDMRPDMGIPSGPLERQAHNPGATFATSPLGRRQVRLYFAITREEAIDGGVEQTSVLSMAGSLDGLTFDRFTGFSFAIGNADMPAPFLLDEGSSTLLVATQQSVVSMLQLRAPIGLVTPLDHVFPFTPPAP